MATTGQISSDRAALIRAIAIAKELKRREPWTPLPGPQTLAFESVADIVGFGGAAGGGKTDLACGKALMQHRRAAIFRREGTQLTGIIDRFTELLESRDGYNGAERIWRNAGPNRVQIEFGSVPNPGDETKHQGRPKDLLVLDEASNFLESQVRFLMGWVRTTVPGQLCQTLMTFNPPTSAEGRWIVDFFAPWLDPKHPNPAGPGELRYAASLPADDTFPNGRDVWVEGPDPFIMVDGEPSYDFNPDEHDPTRIIIPKSRTFIPSRITDNPHLVKTGYMATLQSLPEPLRSQMLYGDFNAGISDDPWQVVPTAWVDEAQARWRRPEKLSRMDSLGVDVARGGKDNTVIARRHGMWFDEPLVYPGSETPDGPKVMGLVMAAGRNRAPIHIDVIGVGSSPYDFLVEANQPVMGVNVSEKSLATDKSGRLTFVNQRAQLWWQFREALDPANNTGIALPPDPRLKADLCAPKWSIQGASLRVESRDDIVKRIGRSPDWASAYILALIDTPHVGDITKSMNTARMEYDPYRKR